MTRDIPYATASERQVLDVHAPAGAKNLPVVFWIHGGGWQTGDKTMGANGQYITVLPALDMVVAHKVDFDDDGALEVLPHEFDAILQMVIASASKSTSRASGSP